MSSRARGAIVYDPYAGLSQGIAQLGAGLGQAGGALGQALQQRGQQQRIARTGTLLQQAIAEAQERGSLGTEDLTGIMSQVLAEGGDPGILQMLSQPLMQNVQATSKMKDMYNFFGGMDGVINRPDEFMAQENADNINLQDKKLVKPERMPIQQKLMLEQQYKGSASIIDKEEERKLKEYETLKGNQNMSKLISEMIELSKFAGPVKGVESLLGTDAQTVREKRRKIDTLALRFINMANELEGKGVLSREKFKDLIKKRIPSSKMTQSGFLGSLQGWNELLGLEVPEFMEQQFQEPFDIKTPQGQERMSLKEIFE